MAYKHNITIKQKESRYQPTNQLLNPLPFKMDLPLTKLGGNFYLSKTRNKSITREDKEIIIQTCQQSQLSLHIILHSTLNTYNSSFSHIIHETMRETMERFSILPFSIGCVSHSSIDVINNQPKKSNRESNPSLPSGEGEEKLNAKPNNISEKLQKIVKGFKSLPQVFYREEEEEEKVMGMEIGFPTDVQHVGHIGWDGSNNTSVSTMKTWDRAPEFMPFPSLSL